MSDNCSSLKVYGGFSVRLCAYIIDNLYIAALCYLIIKLPIFMFSLIEPENIFKISLLFSFTAEDILIYAVHSLYFTICTYVSGATPGKYMFRLKVVSENNEKLTFINILYRETAGRFLSSILYIGYILIFITKEKKAFHDIICDTNVIYRL